MMCNLLWAESRLTHIGCQRRVHTIQREAVVIPIIIYFLAHNYYEYPDIPFSQIQKKQHARYVRLYAGYRLYTWIRIILIYLDLGG